MVWWARLFVGRLCGPRSAHVFLPKAEALIRGVVSRSSAPSRLHSTPSRPLLLFALSVTTSIRTSCLIIDFYSVGVCSLFHSKM
ncbi:hypothetical protein E2C01_001310 [Portunus trituberculatus]|uniref:Uncharacterized protein n=1 Tax=Portunus trituberculatus TaxID=210409 RepID=A0A5B7CK34_PORTR|nr:hypothetical protein [Portunus trituberculatus]